MSHLDLRAQTGVSQGRLEAFSDGVFAIVITLLVLELRLPETLRDDQIVAALGEQWPHLLAYFLSFLSVGVFWVAHHLMLRAAGRGDRTLLWVNNLFLMIVALVPFSASVLGSYPGARAAVVLYGANLIGVELLLIWVWWHITRTGLLAAGTSPRLVRAGFTRTVGGIAVHLLGIALAFVGPTALSIALFWLVPLGYIALQGWLDRSLSNAASE